MNVCDLRHRPQTRAQVFSHLGPTLPESLRKARFSEKSAARGAGELGHNVGIP